MVGCEHTIECEKLSRSEIQKRKMYFQRGANREKIGME